jgi:hypothetical protein
MQERAAAYDSENPAATTKKGPKKVREDKGKDKVTVVTLLLHCCCTVVALLLHCWYTFVTLLSQVEAPIEEEAPTREAADNANTGAVEACVQLTNSQLDIYCENFQLGYERKVLLQECTLKIKYGERIALLGRNGVGKTSLLARLATRKITGFPSFMQVAYVEQENTVQHPDALPLASLLKNAGAGKAVGLEQERVELEGRLDGLLATETAVTGVDEEGEERGRQVTLTVLLHCCNSAVTLLLHCCYIDLTLLLLYCYTVITLLLHNWYIVVTQLLHSCYTVVTLLLHCRYTVVTLLLHCSYTIATLLSLSFYAILHSCYTVVTQLLHSCYTVVTLLLHYCYRWQFCPSV